MAQDQHIINTELMGNIKNTELEELGFIVCYDGEPLGDKEPESAWGISYEMENEKFSIILDCALVVTLYRKSIDGDGVILYVPTLYDLENVISFIQID